MNEQNEADIDPHRSNSVRDVSLQAWVNEDRYLTPHPESGFNEGMVQVSVENYKTLSQIRQIPN